MAESYRGLTIRIGGDTTGLQKALKTSTSAIQGADMELRKLGQALKLDPGNVEAFSLQIGYMGEKATSTAMKLYQMQQAAEQIRNTKTGVTIIDKDTGKEIEQTLGMVAKETENVHLRAEMAKASFNKVRDELHGMYETLTKYNEQVVSKVGDDFAELGTKLSGVFDNADVKKGTKSLLDATNEVIAQIKSKFEDFDGIIEMPEAFGKMANKLREYAADYAKIEDEAQKNTVREAFALIAQEISTATAQVVNFENKLTDSESVKGISKQLTETLGLDEDKVNKFLGEVLRFKDKYRAAMADLQQANDIAGLADLDVEIERANASVNNLAKAIANMNAPSKLLMGMNDLTEKANAFGKAMSESMSRAAAAEKAYEIDPTNVEAAEAAMREYANAEADATSKADALRVQMSKFDDSEIRQYADSTMTATEQLARAAVEHEKATLAVSRYNGAVEATKTELENLSNTANREIRILEPDSLVEVDDLLGELVNKYRTFDDETASAAQTVKDQLIARLNELRESANAVGETELADYFGGMVGTINELDDAYKGLANAQEHAKETGAQLQVAQRRRDFESLQQQLVEVLGSADKARVALQKMMAGDFKMDTKWVDDLKSARSDLESMGSSVAQEFQQATLSITALGGVVDDATQRAKSLIDAFASDTGNTDALRLGVDALKDAFIASNMKAELLRDTISKYEPDSVDEVAIATGAVGTNAELAAAAVKSAFSSLDDAKKRVAELEAALDKALKSAAGNTGGANNERVAQLTKVLESAREEVNRLGVAAEESLNRFNMAKATQELVSHREELAKVDAEYEKLINDTKAMAASLASGGNESFAKRLFGDVNADIAAVKSSFDAAVERAKVLRTAAAEVGNNTEIASQKARAFDDAVAVGKQYVQDLSNAAKNIMPDGETEEVVKLRQEFGSAKNAVTTLTSEATKLNAKVIELSQKRDMSPQGSKNWVELDSTITRLKARLEEIRQRLQGMGDDTKGAIAIAQWEEYIDKIVAANAELSKLETGKLFGTSDSSSGFMQAVNNIMQHVEQFGSKVIESADTIDAAFRDMRKTVDGTESQFESLRESAIRFSQTSFVSADTMLEMEALGGQLGVTVEKLEQFGTVAANLSIATDIGAEDIALQLGQLTNIMSDLSEDTFQNVGDALVRLGNNTATTESKIMGVAERMAAIANVTSMTTPDLLAWSAAIASTGQRSESAATAINNSITGIGQAVAEGGKKLDAFASIAHMSADEFKAAWQTSSSDALEAFVKGLGDLTDESTDAIAALDSVGISSVRQETALLALSQTIDNLDNSMKLAREGFNGGGDAAREAAQKAEGFSGALQILRNNVANLAASFGDGLVPFIKLASGALELLNNVIGSLSPVTKTVIVGITGISTALAVATPVLNNFSNGWKKLSADMATSSSMFTLGPKIAAAMTALSGVKDALFTVGATMASTVAAGTSGAGMMSAAFAGLGTAIGGAATALGGLILPIAGIAALVAVIDTAVNAYNDWKQEQEEFNSAMRSARGEMDATKASIEEYAASLKSSSETAEQIAESTSNFLQSQSEFIDSVSGSLEKVGKDTALIENYAQTIQELSGHVDGNKAKMKLLADTVENYNKLAGSSIQIIDDTTGAVSIQADALRELTDEYKKNAEAAAWADIYQDATTAYVEAQYQRQKAEMDAAEAKKQLTEITKDGVAAWTEEGKKYNELRDKLKEYEKQAEKAGEVEKERKKDLDEFKTIMEKATEATEETAATSEDYMSALSMAGESIDDFNGLTDEQKARINEIQAALAKTGGTLTEYGSLTKQQLLAIVENWDGTSASIKQALEDIANAEEEAAEEAEDAAQRIIDAQKRANEHAYTELKRELDHQYDTEKSDRDRRYEDAKRGYDNDYDLLKRELDHQYDEKKSQYDKDYDAQKDQYDRDYAALKDKFDKDYTYQKRAYDFEYDQLKKHLDREYDELKDAMDSEYNLRKQSLDDQYNATKSAYDKQVEAMKKSLDAEYDALKDSLDKQYDAVKDSLDKQYDAVKDSLDKQYDAVKKSLDNTYNAYKDELDEQYDLRKKALDSEYNALKSQLDKEKAARKKVLDAEVDEYKDSLDDTYDARKKELDKEYKAYQKASQKYLKKFKKEQTAQVDAFKKATDARVKELERELKAQQDIIDAETKRKTNAIDERITALKGETDAENREKKERERAEKTAELQKAVDTAKSRRTRAEAEKELNDYLREIAMEDAQERREQLISELEGERSAIEEDGKTRKDQLDSQYSAETEAFKESRALELEILQEHLDERSEIEQEAEAARLETIKENQAVELENLKGQHTAEIEAIKERNTLELEAIGEQNTARLEAMKESHEIELEALKEQNDAKLAAMKEQNETELAAIKEQNESQLGALKENHESQLSALKESNAARLAAMKDDHEAQVNAAKEANAASLEELKRANAAELEELKLAQADQLQSVKDNNELVLLAKKYEHEDLLQAMKDNQGFELQALKDGQEAELRYIKDNQTAWLQTIKENNEDILKQKKLDQADELSGLKDGWDLELRTFKETNEDKLTDLKEKNEDLIKEMQENKGKVKTEADDSANNVKTASETASSAVEKESNKAKKSLLDDLNEVTGILPKQDTENKNAIVKNWNELGTELPKTSGEIKKSVTGDFDGLNKDGSKSIQEFGKSAISGITEASKTITDKTGEAKKSGLGNIDELEKGSTSSTENIRKDADSKFGDYKDTVSTESGDAKDKFNDNVDKMESAAGNVDLAGAVQPSLNNLELAITTLRTYDWGNDLMNNLAQGISAGLGFVQNAVTSVSNLITSNLGHSVPKEGPMHEGGKGEVVWGQDLVWNFIDGIESMESKLASAMLGLADVVEDKFDPSLPLEELQDYVEYAKTAYKLQEDDLGSHADNVMTQYGAMFDGMRAQLERYSSDYIMSDRDMYSRSLMELESHVADTYDQYGQMYTTLSDYTDRYVDSVEAAYEAIERITKESIEQQLAIATRGWEMQSEAQSQSVVNINVTLSDVTIRETADIDKLAQQLAKRVDQVTRSRIGR